MAHIAGPDRTQAVLLPEVLDDYVRPDNPVRFLDAFVASWISVPWASSEQYRPRRDGRGTIPAICSGSTSTATSTGSAPAAGWSRRPTATSS